QEVAGIVGVEDYVLRYWETKFPMLHPEKDGADQRRYRQKDIELLLRIRELLYQEKYTIAGAVERLREEAKSGRAAPSRVESRAAAVDAGEADMFDITEAADSATKGFEGTPKGLSEDQLGKLRRVRDELGLMK